MADLTTELENYGIENFLRNLGVHNVRTTNGQIRSSCPVHHGNNPSSFAYYNGFFICFSACDKAFHPVELVQKVKGYDRRQAEEYVERLLGKSIEFEKASYQNSSNILNQYWLRNMKDLKRTPIAYKTFDLSNQEIYQDILCDSLKEEGFTEDVRLEFGLKYCTRGWMKNRQIIPIHAPNGDVMGVAGRSIYSNKECMMKHIDKYLFSKGLRKGNTVYNYHKVKDKGYKTIYVVEGYKSVWRLYQWGYPNAVALMGASMKREQRILLLKLNARLVLCGDNDKAGKNLNHTSYGFLKNFTDVNIFPIEKTKANNKDSIAEITKEDFEQWIPEITK